MTIDVDVAVTDSCTELALKQVREQLKAMRNGHVQAPIATQDLRDPLFAIIDKVRHNCSSLSPTSDIDVPQLQKDVGRHTPEPATRSNETETVMRYSSPEDKTRPSTPVSPPVIDVEIFMQAEEDDEEEVREPALFETTVIETRTIAASEKAEMSSWPAPTEAPAPKIVEAQTTSPVGAHTKSPVATQVQPLRSLYQAQVLEVDRVRRLLSKAKSLRTKLNSTFEHPAIVKKPQPTIAKIAPHRAGRGVQGDEATKRDRPD